MPTIPRATGSIAAAMMLLLVALAIPALADGRSLKNATTSSQTIGAKTAAKPGRQSRRRLLLYFAQLSDFQLADEESPARVELLDTGNTQFTSAWRPQEALELCTVDQSSARSIASIAARCAIAQSVMRSWR